MKNYYDDVNDDGIYEEEESIEPETYFPEENYEKQKKAVLEIAPDFSLCNWGSGLHAELIQANCKNLEINEIKKILKEARI